MTAVPSIAGIGAPASAMRRVLHEGQTPRPFSGKADKAVVTAIVTTYPRKAVGKGAACEVFAESFLYVRLWGVVVALAVELSCTGELKPSLEVFGHRAGLQSALGMAGVAGFGGLGWRN